ncbi:MAG: RNA polymerase sigma factor [Mycobacteriales bacterium]
MTSLSPQPARQTDAELIAESWRAPDVFAAIFDRHARTLYRYLGRRVGRETADDLLGETFLIAFDRRHRYDPDQPNALPWLYGIATNLLRRHWRAEARRYEALARAGAHVAMEAPDDEVTDRVVARAAAPELAAGLAGLARRDRDVLLLYAWADLGYAEIATALGIPVGTVRSRLHRARARLRTALGPSVPLTNAGESHHG